MWVEFVVGSLLCSERFFSGYSGFPSPKTPTFPNSHSTRNQVDEEPLCGCSTSKSLFIYCYLCGHWEEYCGSPVFQCIILALLNYTKLNYTKSHHYRYTFMLPFERKHTFNTARDFQRNYVNLGLTE